jgi:hypothetical protein
LGFICDEAVPNIDCVQSAWTSWGVCGGDCGNEARNRTRTITTAQSGLGTACGAVFEEATCDSGNPACAALAAKNDGLSTGWTVTIYVVSAVVLGFALYFVYYKWWIPRKQRLAAEREQAAVQQAATAALDKL